MYTLRSNDSAIIEISFTTLGLFLATGILLSAVVSTVFLSDWQKQAELETMARGFAQFIETMNIRSFEASSTYVFPELPYEYSIDISSEYVVLTTLGRWHTEVRVVQPFIVRPWVLKETDSWLGATGLHEYLETSLYGHSGCFDDPVVMIDEVKDWMQTQQHAAVISCAVEPLHLTGGSTVVVDTGVLHFQLPSDYSDVWVGKEWSYTEGEVNLGEFDGAHISGGAGDGLVQYQAQIPSWFDSDFYQIFILTEWKETGWYNLIAGDGPDLCLIDPSNGDVVHLQDDLGYTGDQYETCEQRIDNPLHFIDQGTLTLQYGILQLEGLIDDTNIKTVGLIYRSDHAFSLEKTSYLFIYEQKE